MIGFEWEFLSRERDQRPLTTRQWLVEQPSWAKVAYFLVVLPAWMLIAINMFTGKSKSWTSILAFGAVLIVALALIVADHRRKSSALNG